MSNVWARTTTGRVTIRAVALLLLGSMYAMLGFVNPTSASTVQPKKALTPTERGMQFYKGKTIIYDTPVPPGGILDLYARAIAPYLGSYLHASVEVVNIPGGNTNPGQDQANAATPDGLTLIQLNLGSDLVSQVTNQLALNFNPQHDAFLGQAAPASLALISLTEPACSSYTTLASLRNASVPAPTLIYTTGTPTDILEGWMGLIGAKVHYIPGYANETALFAGLVRGDGCVSMLGLSQAYPLIASGKARVLALTLPVPGGTPDRSTFSGVPTLTATVEKYAPNNRISRKRAEALIAFNQVSNPLALQTAVSVDKVDAVRAALAWTFKQPGFKTAMLEDSFSTKFVDGVTSKNDYLADLKLMPTLLCYFKQACN